MKIRIGFSFLAVLGFILCTDNEGTAVLCLAACALHELGHLAVMLIERKLPYEISFYGGGVHIKGGSNSLPAVSGGCIVNTVLFFVFYFLPFADEKCKLFAVINLLVAAINLIPVNELDGRAILEKILLKALSPEKVIRIVDIAEKTAVILAVPTVVLLSASGVIGFSSLVFLFYILAVDIFDKM